MTRNSNSNCLNQRDFREPNESAGKVIRRFKTDIPPIYTSSK
ncbi:hypothetical protein [Candidatus Nitrosocosmicus arcticus]|uniref:Uncharacterized protein n=1 Tax=Candidatus Nitrosocosmicus arcticus TaxID=2035267 RepID=A0A557SUB2_9ARCH|nr:hypothetical protein [Candidatus Nitrosocosmicus arcticus]TVP40197.1 hypothetical protein NARC_90103 [Candidatus Nitrosocosmicus arcticus]